MRSLISAKHRSWISALVALTGLGSSVAAQQSTDKDATGAAVAEMLTDIETRSSLLDNGTGAGHDERGFFISGDDGVAKLYINGLVHFRYNMNFRGDAPASQDDFTSGFENRRTQLIFSGNLSTQLSFRTQLEFKADGSTVLKDTYVQYKFGDGWKLKLGQFKPQLLREELVGDLSQLAAERSVVNSVFTQGRSQGLELSREFEEWRIAASFTDGLSADNTDFVSSKEADLALTGRAEYKIAGGWNHFKDFSGWRGSDFGALLGGAMHYQAGGDTGATADVDILEYTADLSLVGDGWNGYAAFIGRNRDDTSDQFNDFGIIVQGGLFVSSQTELFARYDQVLPDGDRGGTGDPFNTISTGLTYFVFENSRAALFRVQGSWFLDAQSESIVSPSTSTGVLADTRGDQIAVMIEFTLRF